jgi:hypothetical protein
MSPSTPRPVAPAGDRDSASSPGVDAFELNAAGGQLVAPAPVQTPVPAERRNLAFMGEIRRMGRWTVPRLLRIRAFLGEVKVDIRDNAIPPGFALDARAWGSRITLIVPPGVPVAFNVFAVMGNAINQADEPGPDTPTAAQIRVVGSAFMGEIRVLVRERETG